VSRIFLNLDYGGLTKVAMKHMLHESYQESENVEANVNVNVEAKN
jgi:hypothetical protein